MSCAKLCVADPNIRYASTIFDDTTSSKIILTSLKFLRSLVSSVKDTVLNPPFSDCIFSTRNLVGCLWRLFLKNFRETCFYQPLQK